MNVDEPLLTALKIMHEKTVTSIALIDEDKAIVMVLSLTDFKVVSCVTISYVLL